MLLQREDLRDRLIGLMGASDIQRATATLNDGANRLSKYFLRQVLINASFGVFIACGLALIGVPSPIGWGVLAALMRFVPYVGSFISAAPPDAARRGGRSGLEHGDHDRRPISRLRIDHGPGG